ncbi:hypothetical protein AB1Y20_016390 [Prymnesium parvum]|uniref:Protein xylosyltransferase n=1 Tax=Prymnesium parvum TaxID=97485 RepID=A0AB34ICK3_PRYPA
MSSRVAAALLLAASLPPPPLAAASLALESKHVCSHIRQRRLEPRGNATVVMILAHSLDLEFLAYIESLAFTREPHVQLSVAINERHRSAGDWDILPIKLMLRQQGVQLFVWEQSMCAAAFAFDEWWCPLFLWLASRSHYTPFHSVWLMESDVRCTSLHDWFREANRLDKYDMLVPFGNTGADQDAICGVPPDWRASINRLDVVGNCHDWYNLDARNKSDPAVQRKYKMRWSLVQLIRLSWYAVHVFANAVCEGWSGFPEVLFPTLCHLDRLRMLPHIFADDRMHGKCSIGSFADSGIPQSSYDVSLIHSHGASRWHRVEEPTAPFVLA